MARHGWITSPIGKVRKSAQDEIDRLIRFRDETETKWEIGARTMGDDADVEPDVIGPTQQ